MPSVKVTSASDLDDNLKQSVSVNYLDDSGNKVNGYTTDFYGTPDTLRAKILDWKQKITDKIAASSTIINKGDIF